MRKIAFWLSLLFIFVLPWENIFMSGGGDTISRAVGIFVAGFWLFTVIATNRIRTPLPFHVAVFAFILWDAISVLWSADPSRTFDRAQTYAQLAIFVFMLWDIYSEPPMLPAGVQAYILGALVTASSTLYNYFNASEFYYNRYAASGFNPNDAGLILALGIPLAWHMMLSPGKSTLAIVLKIVNFIYLPFAIFAIFLTGSRGTLAAGAISLFFILSTFTRLRIKIQLLLIPIIAIAIYILLIIIPTTSLDRISNRGVSLNGREDVWSETFEVLASNPVFGVGGGAVKVVIDKQQAAHNFVLAISAELGLIGLGLFFIILLLVFRHGWQQERYSRYLWLTVFAIWLFGASFHNWEQRKQTWLFFSLIVISGSFASSTPITRFDKYALSLAPGSTMEVV